MVSKRKSRELLDSILVYNGKQRATLKIVKGHSLPVKSNVKLSVIKSLKNWCAANKHTNWEVCDVVYRIAGTGSLGVSRFKILIYHTKLNKYFLLDMKQAVPSSLKNFIKIKQPNWKNEAERVITIQGYLENVTPALLGTMVHENKTYTIKKFQPIQDRMDLRLCKGKTKKFKEVIGTFAGIVASAQLRSTGRQGSVTTDELINFFKKANFWEKDILIYCKEYAVKVNKDYLSFLKETNGGNQNVNLLY